jgi:hypothetical protein
VFWMLVLKPLQKERFRQALPWVVAALVAVDALTLARHYIKPMARSLIEDNDVTRFLKQSMGGSRCALIAQDSFYNAWLTFLFPYHGIRTLNVTQMPRMPEDYKAFLDTFGSQPLRLWQMTASAFLLGPAEMWGQIQQDARVKDSFELVYAYNVVPEPDSGFRVVPSTEKEPGRHAILRMKPIPPRLAMLDSWRVVPDGEVLGRLAAPDYIPFREVLVSASTAGQLKNEPGTAAMSDVVVRAYRPGRMEVRVSTERPAILRAAERYDPAWRATVDDKPAALLRCDYLFQGVLLSPGLHEIVLEYAPARGTLWVQAAGMALCLGALASLAVSGRRKDEQ